jgi:hypothetical protein
MTTATARIHVQQLPVELWRQTQEHSDELIREFMLIATGERPDDDSSHDIPKQLLTVIDEVTKRYAGFGEDNEAKLARAAEEGVASIDLVYDLPTDVADDVRRLGAMLDQADEFCRRGQHLLTLATPSDQVRFRHWFLDEMVNQVSGQEPTPWPDYTGD